MYGNKGSDNTQRASRQPPTYSMGTHIAPSDQYEERTDFDTSQFEQQDTSATSRGYPDMPRNLGGQRRQFDELDASFGNSDISDPQRGGDLNDFKGDPMKADSYGKGQAKDNSGTPIERWRRDM